MTQVARIQLEHVYNHPVAALWRALTDPHLHAQWWAAGDIKAVVGHHFELDMGPWGKQPCEVLEVEHERRLRYRFATTSLDTTITWHLTPLGDRTQLTLIQEGFDLDSPISRRAFEGMKPGWPGILARLEKLLANALDVTG